MSASQLSITLTTADLATAGTYPVVVTSPAPGGGSSLAFNFTVSTQVSVSITPTAAQVQVFHSQQFTATLAGSSGAAFSWSVNGVANGNLTIGQIDSTGLFTAPNNQPSPSQVTITATDQSEPTKTASASVTIGADAAPPAITSELPGADETEVSLDSGVQIEFSDALDPSTVTRANFTLTSSSGTAMPVSVSYDPTSYSVSLTPRGLLSAGAQYTVGVANTVADPAGETLPNPVSWTFTTQSATAASATIGTTLVADPATVTVISYGGQETVPDSNGNFTASVAPLGNSLVAAMVPGKNFGWMAFVADQNSTAGQAVVKKARENLARLQTHPQSRLVIVTKYQVTSSSTVAASPDQITADATTTAESMLFMTPYFYTSDPTAAATIQQAIASDPTIPALANALTAAAGETDPLSNSTVQSALASSVISIWSTLTSGASNSTAAGVVESNESFEKGRPAPVTIPQGRALSSSSSSSSITFTPGCFAGDAKNTSSGSLQCLDLDFIRLTQPEASDAFQLGISDENCSHGLWSPSHFIGCGVDWLALIGPKDGKWSPSGGVQSIVGLDDRMGKGWASPVGDFDPNCSDSNPGGCLATVQMVGGSLFDLGNISSRVLLPAFGIPVDVSATVPVPSTPGNYLMRAYSGGVGDFDELGHVLANDYDEHSKQLWLDALGTNAQDVLWDSIDTALTTVGLANDSFMRCIAAVIPATNDLINQISNDSFGSIASFQAAFASVLDNNLKPAKDVLESCGADAAKTQETSMFFGLLQFGSVEARVDASIAISAGVSVGQATEKIGQLIRATPVETAIISVQSTGANVPPPSVTGIEPYPMTTGSTSQSVTIDGSGFPTDAMVSWKDPAGNVTGPSKATVPVTAGTFKGWGDFTGKPGTWYVEIGDTTVNSGWFPFTVSTSTTKSPDLVPQAVSASPASVAAGGTVTVTFTVANKGNAAAVSSTTGFRLGTSPTTHPAASADIPNSMITTDALPSGTSIQRSRTLTIPASTPAGTYYMWVVVDDVPNSTLGQSDQSNDYAPSNALTISASQNPAPKVSGVAPTPVPASTTAATLTINGVNFVQGATLIFYDPQKNQYLRSATFVNSGTLTHQFNNSGDVGSWNVLVQNPDGQQSGAYTFQVSNSSTTPALQQLTTAPNPPLPGQQFTLSLIGSGFDPSSAEILISGPGCTPCTIANSVLTTKTASQIVAAVTVNTAGTYSVTVENTSSKAQSAALSFIVGVSQVPSVSYISPTMMTANSASNPNATQPLYIYGSNFASGNVVQFYWTKGNNAYYWNTSNSTPTITSTLITIPMNPGLVADTINVRVCESASQATASTCSSGIQAVTVAAAVLSPPSLLTPANGATGVTPASTPFSWTTVAGADAGYRIMIATSSGVLPRDASTDTCGSCVFNAMTAAGVTSWSPPTPLNSGTQYFWQVHGRSSAGGGTWSGISSFTTLTLPVINSINPPTPTMSSSPQAITINGTSFQNGAQVTFTPPVGATVWVTPSSVTAIAIQVSPTLNQTGTWAVDVKNADGGIAVPVTFNVAAAVLSPPTLLTPANGATGVTPASTPFSWTTVAGADAGYRIMIATSSGVLPRDASTDTCGSCVFNAMTAAGVTSWSPPTPLNSGTQYFWQVHGRSSAGGGTWSGISSFTTLTLPVINSINPPTPTMSSSPQAITINGTSFQNGAQVTFTPPVGATVWVTPSSVTAIAIQVSPTLNQTGTWAVDVKNPDGGIAVPHGFTVSAAVPSIDHVYPTTMTASTTALTTFYVYGYNFSTSGGQLQFLDPNNIQYSSNSHPERIVAVIPTEWVYNLNNGGTKGTWKVRVVNADSQPSGWVSFNVQ